METVAKIFIKKTLKLVNLILGSAGIAILMYSCWMVLDISREYQKYIFSAWFLWANITTGIIFCSTSCMGYIGAATRNKTILSCYILCVFLVLLMELLVVGDVSLNHNWEKDFPKDPAHGLEDFMDFVHSHKFTFQFLMSLIFILQLVAFWLAMTLRVSGTSYFSNDVNQVSTWLPFLAHQAGPISPYVMGHPSPSYIMSYKDYMSSGEKEAWLLSTYGCLPPIYV